VAVLKYGYDGIRKKKWNFRRYEVINFRKINKFNQNLLIKNQKIGESFL